MKKKIIVVLLFSLFSTTVFSQKTKREEGIIIGIKGGLNISNFIGNVEDQGMRTSVHLGLLAEIMISDNFSIQPEILYSKQGSTHTGIVPGFYRTKLDYISLPVEGKFKIVGKLSFEAGPQLGILMSSRLKTSNSNAKIDTIKTIDFGINAGLRYNINDAAFIQGRYVLGLIDNGVTGDSNNQNSNSVIQLSIGYLF
ncbi:porin family protein [Flavobacterium sp. W22_SRS_FP1]|uniref:porin family protein n=1 Tax=Flavobacterium sp. W22_SRS_FP1 TaxID=3240276 RepID=UPI003F8EA831